MMSDNRNIENKQLILREHGMAAETKKLVSAFENHKPGQIRK